MNTPIHWFEIPVADFERAVAFYETVFTITLRREATPAFRLAVFPYADGAVGGALSESRFFQPGIAGPAIYLDGGEDLAVRLGRVDGAGGKVLMPKTLIAPEIGYMAFFADSEGNRIGLHSPN